GPSARAAGSSGRAAGLPSQLRWRTCCRSRTGTSFVQHATAHLVEFHRFEQRLEVAFAEALVALPLDELEEDRPELVFAEDLQQQLAGLAVDQDLALLQLGDVLAVSRDALVDQLVIRIDRVEQLHAARAHGVDGLEEILRA